MPNRPFKIKNWKLATLALIFIIFFMSLGIWQLMRAHEKKMLLAAYTLRTRQIPFLATDLKKNIDLRFHRVKLTGIFDNQHNLLLDNKIFKGRVGYEIYTPFYVTGFEKPLLVDRGFIPMGKRRDIFPGINAIVGNVTITGMLNVPPTYVALGNMNDASSIAWPLRVEFINLSQLKKVLNYSLFNYVVTLSPNDPAAYAIEWQVVMMGPEKHLGYAFQWFAFAATLLIIYLAVNTKKIDGN